MKAIHFILLGSVALWSLPLMAILPPDAQYRQREIVQQRVRARADYEQYQKNYEKDMIASRIKMEAAMKKPPWMRAGENKSQEVVAAETAVVPESSPQINHRFLVSIMLLILIGAVAGCVRYATRKVDE